jgi:hypothetical protein
VDDYLDVYCDQFRELRKEAGWSIERCERLMMLPSGLVTAIETKSLPDRLRRWDFLQSWCNQLISLINAELDFRRVDAAPGDESARLRGIITAASAVLRTA